MAEMDSLVGFVEKAKRWLEGHGALMLNKEGQLVHIPATLFPSPIPESGLKELVAIQLIINELVDTVSRDHEFLSDVFENFHDSFTRKLFNVYSTVHREGYIKPAVLGLHRSDYMLHLQANAQAASTESTESTASSPPRHFQCPAFLRQAGDSAAAATTDSDVARLAACPFRQIEINTIAASFGALASRMPMYHRYMLGWMCGKREEQLQSVLPENDVMTSFARGIAQAWEVYGEASAVVVMLVNPGETNIFDQSPLENALMLNHGVRMVRATLGDLIQRGRLDESKRRYYLDDIEVAVIYMRTCYAPELIATDKEWEARLAVERARCVVCPAIPYQLVGAKKVQQLLANPAVLARFVPDQAKASRLQAVFAKLWSLDLGPEGDEAAALALENPSRYVMKPQREGGGNNLYDEDIREMLLRLKDDRERGDYILMERVLPPPHTNYLLDYRRTAADVRPISTVNELGVYGVFVRSEQADGEVLINDTAGFLLRTKSADVNEGGVMVGAACLDSPLLV